MTLGMFQCDWLTQNKTDFSVDVIVNLMVVLPSPSPLLTSCPGEGRVGAEPGLCRLHLHQDSGFLVSTLTTWSEENTLHPPASHLQ